MKICYFIVLFVFCYLIMPFEQKKIISSKIRNKQKCQNIKCPPIDDPVCVKIKNQHMKEINIVAINKCEIKYASCHKDVDATFVPMENCLHDYKKHRNITSKRSKRDVEESVVGKGRADSESEEKLNNQMENNENDESKILHGRSDDSEEIKAKVKKLNEADENHSELDDNNYGDSDKVKKKSPLNDTTVEELKSEVDENYIEKLKAVDNVGSDYDQHDEKVDLEENNKNCPTVCPLRDVMVCAKCQHNIHRTFLSLCHLRMFACKHTREKLLLVKREPCVQSAPFISEFNHTKGRIPESGEQDEVHKFIFCRDKELLKKGDPRCRFEEKDE